MKDSSFSISFDQPVHGWLPTEIRIADEVVSFAASNVFNDPVRELATGARSLLHGATRTVSRWWLEPKWYALIMERETNSESVCIVLFCDHPDEMPNPSIQQFTTIAPLRTVCQGIAKSLRAMIREVDLSSDEGRRAWNSPFPEDTITEIYEALRSEHH